MWAKCGQMPTYAHIKKKKVPTCTEALPMAYGASSSIVNHPFIIILTYDVLVSYIIIGGFRPEQFFPNVEKNTPTTYILTNIYILETMPPPIFNALSVASLREAKKTIPRRV